METIKQTGFEGLKAIKILAPCIYKKKPDSDITDTSDKIAQDNKDNAKTEEPEKILVGFKIVNVFDISQTEGEPLPELAHKLQGNVDEYSDFMEALKQFSPVPIEFKSIEGTANGYYHLIDKNIVIDDGMSQMMNCKTAIHEIAHALLHDKDNGIEKDNPLNKQTKEVQAESVAFTVSNYFGIDTSDYSFGYIGGWSNGKDLKELKESLDTIRQTSQMIIAEIEQKLDAIKQSKQINICITPKDDLIQNKQPHKMSIGH